jgi:hypothetical protein
MSFPGFLNDNSGSRLVAVAAFAILVAGMQIIPAFGQSATTYTLTVNTQYTTGQTITGMWTTLSQNGRTVATGFSPVKFTLAAGQQYTVAVSNYGTYTFERWQDTGSTSAARTVSISQNTALTALYTAPASSPPPPPPSSSPATHMSDTTASYGLSTYSARQAHVEYVSSASQLVGDNIDSITVKMRKVGAPTGTVQIGVFNSDLSVKRLFGTIDASALADTYTDYTFNLASGSLYTIASGDRIGVKFAGGSSANLVAVMIDNDPADPFDGANTYRQQYTTSWESVTGDDLYMTLRQVGTGGGGGTATNARPTANNQSVSMNENTAVTITLSGSDPEGQPLKFYITSQPSKGTLGLIDQNTRTVTYRSYDFNDGPDSFTFVANDGNSDSAPATVSISIANTASKTTSRAVVISVFPNGHSVNGLWTMLSQNGVVLDSGYSQIDFGVNNGQQYTIDADPGYANLVFDHWQDTGSTSPSKAISITKDTGYIAVYRTT